MHAQHPPSGPSALGLCLAAGPCLGDSVRGEDGAALELELPARRSGS